MAGGTTGALLYAVSAAVLGMLQFGFNTGVINAPRAFIENFIREQNDASPSLVFSVIVSIFAVGGMIGCPLASYLVEKRGRKNALLINSFIGIVGAALMGFSKVAYSVEMLIIGRFIIGINCGFATTASPTYVSEIAPLNLRGAFGTVNQLAVALGMVGGQILGIDVILGSDAGWPWLLGLAIIPSVLQCIMLPFAPESPRFLLLSVRDEEKARIALTKIRGTNQINDEINDMHVEDQAAKEEDKFSIADLFKISSLRTPLLIGIVMHLSQQLGGINAVLYYSVTIFQSAGLEESVARLASIGVGSVLFVMALVSIPLMDRLGRRTLQLVGLGGMTVFSVLMTIAFFTYENNTTMSTFAVIFTFLYVAFFGVGPSSIPWMILSELFNQGARSAAVSVGALVNWFANFVVGLTFIPMSEALDNYVFLPYTVLLILFFLFTFFKLPETKNRTIEEVTALFKN
ncbi:glucose transporter type 1-like [Galleria mellonella]|uniref:Glucose transporter type 1-like n=1 Tax=Galleria mellonella TaxID=7137 RepID=A0A6J1WUC3_GALME|nr:glucose transporter type 1-like [Galleria mellonella]XP_026759581.2 glucose transporter type 1-like [Galleria mellonella]XP_026759582.2 glucose transporter type 1-like [Galleria mellonella]XP_031763868.2 glucose transporter type 1-like [Galleria mellonella]